jgi:hypothetical protein
MFLTGPSLFSAVRNQYRFKARTNSGLMVTLAGAQLLALLLSLGGLSTSSVGFADGTQMVVRYISTDIVIVFSLFWAFAGGITIAGNGFRHDFAFVSNRLSSHLSGILLLITAAVLAGTTATLAAGFLRVAAFFLHSGVDTGAGFWIAPQSLLAGILTSSLYAFLLASIGYFCSMLALRNRAYVGLLAGLFIGTLVAEARYTGNAQLINRLLMFFYQETSFIYFTLKVLAVSSLLLAAIVYFSRRMEVRL